LLFLFLKLRFLFIDECLESCGELRPQYRVSMLWLIGFEALQRVFSPEWINRLDEIVAFRPLSSDILRRVLDRMIDESNNQYLRQGVHIKLTPEAKEYFLQKGFDSRFGARPLRQCLLKNLDAPLADMLASGGIPSGSRVIVEATGIDRHGEALDFYYEPAPELLQEAERLRAAEVGGTSALGKDPQMPSISLSSEGGLHASTTSTSGSVGARGPFITPPHRDT